MKTRILWAIALLCALPSMAQQAMGPITTPQVNTNLYIGPSSFYRTIQATVTYGCGLSTGARIVIPVGATPVDTIGAVTGGCAKAPIRDERVTPIVDYAWNGSVYAAVSSAGGVSNILAGDGINVTSSGGVYTISQGTAFAISSFAGCNSINEIGASVTNPTCAASYTSTPTSAQITNTDGTSSPTNLTTPFTSGTIAGTFSKSASSCVTFTLTAVGASTKTATQQMCFRPRTFYGVGTGGATGATASGTKAVLTGATGTLNSWGLATETGTVSVSPSSQFIYFLLSGASHTFNVNGFPTTFSSSAVTFTNAQGVATSMTLYSSPTSLTGTYSVQVF